MVLIQLREARAEVEEGGGPGEDATDEFGVVGLGPDGFVVRGCGVCVGENGAEHRGEEDRFRRGAERG